MLAATRGSLRPNSGAAAASPVSITLRKSGLRPNMPQVASIHSLIMPRRRIRSSTERGSMKERPTGPPPNGVPCGEGEGHLAGERRVVLHVVELGQGLRRAG